MIYICRNKTDKNMKTLKNVKKGDFFRLNDTEKAPVWVKGDYLRSEKAYECYKYEDCMHVSNFRGTRIVHTEFEY